MLKIDLSEHNQFVGQYIEKVRKELNITQDYLCSTVRMSKSYYSKIIKGSEMKFNYYFRTLAFMLETEDVCRKEKRDRYEEFMVEGVKLIKVYDGEKWVGLLEFVKSH